MLRERSRTSHEQRHLVGMLAQEDRGLTGGVPGSDHGHPRALAPLRLHRGGGVVHPRAFKPSESLRVESAVARTGGQDDAAGAYEPRSRPRHVVPASLPRLIAASGITARTPKRDACTAARSANSAPDTPAGNPR